MAHAPQVHGTRHGIASLRADAGGRAWSSSAVVALTSGSASFIAVLSVPAVVRIWSMPPASTARMSCVHVYTRSSSATPFSPWITPLSHTMLPSSAHSGASGLALWSGNGCCGMMSTSGSAMRPDWFAKMREFVGTGVLSSSISQSTSTRSRCGCTLSTLPTWMPRNCASIAAGVSFSGMRCRELRTNEQTGGCVCLRQLVCLRVDGCNVTSMVLVDASLKPSV
jgi:hypothetical protein